MARKRTSEETAPAVLASLTPSETRRWVAVGIQGLLGLIVVWLGAILPGGAILPKIGLLLAGALILAGTLRLWRSTSFTVDLTAEALTDSAGRVIARIDEIRSVDRGAFAFKPANGFLLHLETGAPRAWVPGVWWRIGRFVGVGGVTSRNEGKAMAEAIALLVAERR